jgi:hypothetical protein
MWIFRPWWVTVHDGAATVPAFGVARRTGLLVWPTA